MTAAYAGELLTEIERLRDVVGATNLALQWDCPFETVAVATDTGATLALDPPGLHLCYGDFEHRHIVEPTDLGAQVDLANAVTLHARRPPAWLSFTVPQYRTDDAYFAPLAGLRTDPATEHYFSVIPFHPGPEAERGSRTQIEHIDRYLSKSVTRWDLCTECGMSYVGPDEFDNVLRLHRELLDDGTVRGGFSMTS